MSKTIICIGGRCSTWGTSWKKHLYDGGEECLRCGMSRKEQFEEDKMSGLVSGEYKPNTGKPRAERPVTSKQTVYCALGDYGIEYSDPVKRNVQAWIDSQMKHEDVDADYYHITSMTKAELAALPEV